MGILKSISGSCPDDSWEIARQVKMKLKTLNNINVGNKLILLRIDVNSPVVNGKVLDNPRFQESAKTISFLLRKRTKIAIIAHQGRKGISDYLSLKQHSLILSKHVKKKINYIDDLFGSKAKRAILRLKVGNAILLKNVRDYDDELEINKKDNRYKRFCSLFDIYVNEAFSVSHREQGSILLPPKFLPSYAGLNMEKELRALSYFNLHSSKKAAILIGGSKVEDSLPLFNILNNKNSVILASGVLANLFLISKGINLGYENQWLKKKGYFALLPKLNKLYKKHKKQIVLPSDFAVDNNGRRQEIFLSDFPLNKKILDVGHATTALFKKYLSESGIIFMKGPPGFSEIQRFSYSTIEILRYLSRLSQKKKIFSLLGGGHLTTSIKKYKIPNNFSHISSAGGALIAFLSGEKLPGIRALEKSKPL